MNSNYYRFYIHIRDKSIYQKAKCLCDISSNRKIEEEVFNQLVNQLIQDAYDRKPSPLGVWKYGVMTLCHPFLYTISI